LVSALAFAHAKRIKHEDIKPRNILIKDRQPYLADFGCAKDFSELEHSASVDTLGFGTPVYWPPESLPRGRAADVFSLGCVFSEMLTVRQRETLGNYQETRHVPHRDNAYAFRENLPVVTKWVKQFKNRDDSVGLLLIEQTLRMLDDDSSLRPEAKDVKKALRWENEAVFCSSCS